MTVYIGLTPEKNPIVDTNVQVLRNASAEIITQMPLREYLGIGHHKVKIAIVDGKAVLSLQEPEATQKMITAYKSQLVEIDNEAGAGRPTRELLLELAARADIENIAVDNIREYENRAKPIRSKLTPYLAQ